MIVSAPLTSNFTVLSNDLLNDERLSMEARFVASWLLSKPRDWIVHVDHLRKQFRCGRQRMQAIIRELIATGWAQRRTLRSRTKARYAGSDYFVFNTPQPVQQDLSLEDDEDDAPTSRERAQADGTAPDELQPQRAESQRAESQRVGIETPYKEPTPPRTDSPPSVSSETESPRGPRSKRAHVCPADFEPSPAHFAQAEARGFDRAFVLRIRDRMHEWSAANAHRAAARKVDWGLTLTGFLRRDMDEAADRAARRPQPSSASMRGRSTNGALSLASDMIGLPDDPSELLAILGLGPSPAAHDGYAGDGPVHRPVHQSPGAGGGRFLPAPGRISAYG